MTARTGSADRGRRRWLRAALPLFAVLALIAVTVTVHLLQQPDPTDKSFLSPTSTAGDGAERLAARLTAAGVRVDRRTGTLNALSAATGGAPATVLITTPGLVYPDYLAQLRNLPSGSRAVLIAPDRRAVSSTGLDADQTGPRWTAAAPAAGCPAPYAVGPAAVLRWRYSSTSGGTASCYGGGVLETAVDGVTITLVGAADAFRNDRAGEHDNQAFATGLLTRTTRVIWLDLHKHEEPPPVTREPRPTGPKTTEPTESSGGDSSSDDGQTTSGGGQRGDQGDGGDSGGSSDGGSPLGSSALGRAFPPAFWATILLVLLAGLALAAASARRLGTPVAEPLPVRVRAAETVRGLGGLYRRARARDTSLATVQAAAVRRLAQHFGMLADSSMGDVAERVAAYTGQPVEDVRSVLGGAAEKTDRELALAATTVQSLVRWVTQQRVIDEGKTQ
jgi:hypothetical protein